LKKIQEDDLLSSRKLGEFMSKRTETAVNLFLDDEVHRTEMLRLLEQHHAELIISFIPFFEGCVDEAFQRSSGNGRFLGYSECLTIILDVMMLYRGKVIPPVLFLKIGNAFDRLVTFIGPGLGQSHASHRQWSRRKHDLCPKHVRELQTLARRKGWSSVRRLLREIDT